MGGARNLKLMGNCQGRAHGAREIVVGGQNVDFVQSMRASEHEI